MGGWTPPLGTLVGLPKATARVDSRLKLTFAQLASKSTHHVWQLSWLHGSRCRVRLGLWWRVNCILNFSQKLASLGNYNCWMKNKLILHNQKYRRWKRNEILWNSPTWNKIQDAYPSVLGGHEGHTPKSCCPLRCTLLISWKFEKSYVYPSLLCTSFTLQFQVQ